MKRLYPLLFISVLIFLSCEEPKEEEVVVDTIPPTVTITSPQNGSTVSDSITITCMSSDNEGIEKVELWVNGVSTGVTDNTEPYSLNWNTITLEDGSFTIIVRSYDLSGNTTDSEPIILTVHNTPTEVTLWGVVYSVEDTDTLVLEDNQLTGSIPSEIGNLTNLTYLNLSNNQLSGSIPSEIGNLTNLTTLGLGSNQLTGSIPPEMWNLTNLTQLGLDDNQLTGSIPSEIGNLTNLTYLNLSNNQLSGIIPDEICNQGDSSPILSNNQLCPPYPPCIEDYVGTQDTSGCD
jgi:Leucine-rich repeat (LRR) protein